MNFIESLKENADTKMIKILRSIILLCLYIPYQTSAQFPDSIRQKIQQIVNTKDAIVGVSIIGSNKKDTLSFDHDRHFPMQSVFKLPIALAFLSEIDKGKFSLNQKITIAKEDLHQNTWSPIRDKYPNGANLSISEIINYTVAESDNNGCDILLRLIGGTKKVEDYFRKINFKNLSIKATEEEMHKEWNVQFQNWTTPKAASELLELFYTNKEKILSKRSHEFIWKVMRETSTGKNRLKGELPKTTIVAHKTGTSDTNNEGLTVAVNDIGIIFLPNKEHFFISVFVTDSKENTETNEKIIADITKVTWDYFTSKTK